MQPMRSAVMPPGWNRRRDATKLPVLPVVGIALATPVLAWAAAIGKQPTPEPYAVPMFGPYAVNVWLERAVVVCAAVVVVIGLALLVRATISKSFDLRGWCVLALLAAGGLVAAIAWRVETSGANPAVRYNIGGGAIVLLAPVAVAGLLAGAAAVGTGRRNQPRGRRTALIVAALLTAPLLIGIQSSLDKSDSLARVAQGDYDQVHLGDTRAQVRDVLGNPGDDNSFSFPPAPSATRCDYYDQYQLCFRGDRLVRKATMNRR